MFLFLEASSNLLAEYDQRQSLFKLPMKIPKGMNMVKYSNCMTRQHQLRMHRFQLISSSV